MPNKHGPLPTGLDPQADRDAELLADLTAQPTLEEAREAYDFWSSCSSSSMSAGVPTRAG